MKHEITASVKVRFTDQDIDDIMVSALEGGVNYWCDEVRVVEDEYYGEYASEQISRGGTLRFFDSESDESWDLTLDNFMQGMQLWVMSGDAFVYGAITENGDIDAGQIDAISADSIIQLALFGEYMFG